MAQITKTQTGASVKFPFELKDEFQKAFPSAKWNKYLKHWEVGPRSVKRLEQWGAEIEKSGIEQEIAARDEADLGEKEVAALTAEIARVRIDVEAARRSTATIEVSRTRAAEMRAKLAEMRAELDLAKAEMAAAQAAEEAVKADIDARIAHITTRARIDVLRREMRKHWIPKAYERARFAEVQSELAEIRRELAAAGITCEAVALAVNANFNRRDRDLADLDKPIEFVIADGIASPT